MTHAEKILIVEDEAIIATFISSVLKSNGYFVTIARNGKDALEEVKKSDYDLVLLDIGLPDVKGTELLKMIREKDHYLIVIMITGAPRPDYSIISDMHGADGYLVKPIRGKDLVDIVEEKLKHRFNRIVDNYFN